MAGTSSLVERLIDRLLLKTKEKKVSWEQSLEGNTFSARFDDFIVQIDEAPYAFIGGSITMRVKRLDGTLIITTGAGVIISTGSSVALLGGYPDKLRELFSLVDTRASDLEQLISKI